MKEVVKEPEIPQPAPIEEEKKEPPRKRRFTVEAEELLGQSID